MESCIFTDNFSVRPPNLFVQLIAAHLINNSSDVYEAFISLVDCFCTAQFIQEAWSSIQLSNLAISGVTQCDALYYVLNPRSVELTFQLDNLKLLNTVGLAVWIMASSKFPFTVEIMNSYFENKGSVRFGGRLSIQNCTFVDTGGGSSSVMYLGNILEVSKCEFTGSSGGAITYYATGSANLEVANTRFSRNMGEFEGADITLKGSSISVYVDSQLCI